MSAEASGYVYRMSPYTGVSFAVHLAIADSVNDQNDYELWASAATIGAKARTTRESATRSMKQMEADGYLALLEERPGRTSRYRFEFPSHAEAVWTPGRKRPTTSDEASQVVRSVVTPTSDEASQDLRSVVTRTQEEPKSEPNGTQASLPGLPGRGPSRAQQVRDVFEAWRISTGKTDRTVLDEKRRKLIETALTLYPLADVLDAVRGWENSSFHRGDNDRGQVYNDLTLLLRNAERIEKFRNYARGPREPDRGRNRTVMKDRTRASGRVEL